MNSDPYLLYNAASTNKLTPKASNNLKSKDLDANSLLFEHVDIQNDTTKDTFINLLVSEKDECPITLSNFERYAFSAFS